MAKQTSFKKYSNITKIFSEFGWVKVEKFYSKNDVSLIKKEIKNFFKKNQNKYNSPLINYTISKNNKKINSFHKLQDSKKIKKFSKNNKITSMVKKLLKINRPKLRQIEFFAKPKLIGLKAPCHQDNFYWNLKDNKGLTIWIALNNSDKKNGGIYYHNGTHKIGLMKHVPSFSKGSSQKIKDLKLLNKYKKVYPKLNVGDILIHHSMIAHGSNRNKSNQDRKGLTFQFINSKSKLNLSRMKKYRKSLNNQIGLN